MKWQILTIGFAVFLLSVNTVFAEDVAGDVNAAGQAFRLRLDGHSQQAEEMLSGYLKEHPDDAIAQFEYSRVLFYLFKIDEAEKHATLAAQQDAENPTYHCWRGMCAMYRFIDEAHHKNKLDPLILKRAIEGYQKAVELKPDYYFAHFLLVNMFNNNPPEHGGDKKQARQHADYLMEADLDYGMQAMMLVKGKKSQDWKIEQYKEALAKSPENGGLHAQIALLYARSDQMEKSQEHLDKALELDKGQKNVLLDLTFQLAMKKQYKPAIEMTERYLKLAADEGAPMRAFALFYLAKIEKMSGSPEADKKLKQMKQVDPDGWTTMKAPPAILFEPLE